MNAITAIGLFVWFFVSMPILARSQVIRWAKNGAPANRSAGLQRSPRITTDGLDGAIIAWENLRSAPGDIYAQRLNLWGQPLWDTSGVAVCKAADIQRLAGMIGDGSGGAIIAWSDRRNGIDYDIYIQHLDPAGNMLWKADGEVVCGAAGDQLQCQLIPDSEGGAFLAWQDKRNGTVNRIFAQHISNEGQPLWQADGVACSGVNAEQTFPVLASDGMKGVYVLWVDKRGGEDIYAQRVSPSGTPLWNPDGIAVCVANRTQYLPRVAPDGRGGIYAAWLDQRSSDTAEVYVQRISPSGVLQLTPATGLLMASSGPNITKNNLELMNDGIGGAIAAWTGYPSGGSAGNIYGRKIDGTGTLRWGGISGLLISGATDSQEMPRLVTDYAGGIFVLWQDKQNTQNYDIFMQRVDAAGNLKWSGNGLPVVQQDNDQIGATIAESGPGKVCVTWQDGRTVNGSADIYAQFIGFAPVLQLPDSVVFKNTRVGRDDLQKLRLKNSGADTLVITAFSLGGSAPGDFFVAGQPGLPLRIQPYDSTFLSVNFRPTAAGRRTASFSVTSNASPSPQSVLLSARGELPDLGATPATINMGRIKVGTSKDTTLTGLLKNTGLGSLTIQSLSLGGRDGNQFSLINPPAIPFVIPEGQSTSLTIRHTAAYATVTTASLIIVSDGTTSNRVVTLTDTAAYPIPTFLPAATITFPLTGQGKQAVRFVMVRDSSSSLVPLDVRSVTVAGRDPLDYTASASLPLPAILRPRDSLLITVTFSPVGGGIRYGELRIATDHPASPKNISLYGSSSIPVTVEEAMIAHDFAPGQNYPNPFTESTFIPVGMTRGRSDGPVPAGDAAAIAGSEGLLSVRDLLGRVVLNQSVSLGEQSGVVIHRSQLPGPGIYFYSLTIGDLVYSKSMLCRGK